MKSIHSLLAIAGFASMNTYEPPAKRGEPARSPLSKKAKKLRAKNKVAKQTRKNNRKK
jgi:hypothetical protein